MVFSTIKSPPDFICLLKYTDKAWKGKMSEREIMETVRVFSNEYCDSFSNGKATDVMLSFCNNLLEDMELERKMELTATEMDSCIRLYMKRNNINI